MHFNSEDLLSFCAQYALAKSAARPPLSTLNSQINVSHQPKPKEIKTGRKKVEVVQSRKVVRKNKPKLQQVTSKNQKKSVSPIGQNKVQSKNYDLDYFMNQLSDRSFGQRYNEMQYRGQQHENRPVYAKRLEMPAQNYDTFGKSNQVCSKEFQIFDQKVKRQGYLNVKRNETFQAKFNQYSVAQNLKKFSENNSWLFENHNTRHRGNEQSPIPNNQQNSLSEKKMNYSPSARNYSPTPSSVLSSSWINPTNNENYQIKSKTRHQRNKSQIPFYEANKQVFRVENEPARETKQEQSLLSQSFVSLTENSNMCRNMSQQLVEQTKRDTSTTVGPRKYLKMQQRNMQNQASLSEVQGQNLAQFQPKQLNPKRVMTRQVEN